MGIGQIGRRIGQSEIGMRHTGTAIGQSGKGQSKFGMGVGGTGLGQGETGLKQIRTEIPKVGEGHGRIKRERAQSARRGVGMDHSGAGGGRF